RQRARPAHQRAQCRASGRARRQSAQSWRRPGARADRAKHRPTRARISRRTGGQCTSPQPGAGQLMNQIVIFFVPARPTPRMFEAALREYAGRLDFLEAANERRNKSVDAEHSLLWTWFLPNPLERPESFQAETPAGFTTMIT